MSKTVNEVIREIKYLKLQRKNSDEIQDLSDQVKTLTQDQEKLAQANLKLIREIKKVLGKEEVNQIEEPEEDEDQEEFEDDEEEEEEEEKCECAECLRFRYMLKNPTRLSTQIAKRKGHFAQVVVAAFNIE